LSALGVAVMVAVGERDARVVACERRAGEALRMTDQEGLTVREAVLSRSWSKIVTVPGSGCRWWIGAIKADFRRSLEDEQPDIRRSAWTSPDDRVTERDPLLVIISSFELLAAVIAAATIDAVTESDVLAWAVVGRADEAATSGVPANGAADPLRPLHPSVTQPVVAAPGAAVVDRRLQRGLTVSALGQPPHVPAGVGEVELDDVAAAAGTFEDGPLAGVAELVEPPRVQGPRQITTLADHDDLREAGSGSSANAPRHVGKEAADGGDRSHDAASSEASGQLRSR
jgi:hypothetical protein